jgi:hypothetical protein
VPAEPYQDTSVPVARSQAAIEKALTDAGALGVRFNMGRFRRLQALDDTADTEPIVVEFVWPVAGGEQIVRLSVMPKPAEMKPWSSRGARGWRVSPEQRERQAWRGLYWYLEGTLKAATFGLIRFEDIFLSFIVTGDDPAAPTVGELMIEHLQAGVRPRALLYAPEEGEVLEGEVER